MVINMNHEYKLGSIVTMKKPHACKTNEWKITRVGVFGVVGSLFIGWIGIEFDIGGVDIAIFSEEVHIFNMANFIIS